MTEKKEIQTEKFIKKVAGIINRNVVIFAFFLFLSFIFWYLNALGKEVEAEINYPVNFINLPKERVIAEVQPAKLNLFLKGPGYALLRCKLTSNRSPVIIDVSKVTYKRVQGSKNLTYYIVTSGIYNSLKVSLKSDCEITSVKPDTLLFTLDVIAVADSVPVNPDN